MASRLALNIFGRLCAFVVRLSPRGRREQIPAAVVVVEIEHRMRCACADVVWPAVVEMISSQKEMKNNKKVKVSGASHMSQPFPTSHNVLFIGFLVLKPLTFLTLKFHRCHEFVANSSSSVTGNVRDSCCCLACRLCCVFRGRSTMFAASTSNGHRQVYKNANFRFNF